MKRILIAFLFLSPLRAYADPPLGSGSIPLPRLYFWSDRWDGSKLFDISTNTARESCNQFGSVATIFTNNGRIASLDGTNDFFNCGSGTFTYRTFLPESVVAIFRIPNALVASQQNDLISFANPFNSAVMLNFNNENQKTLGYFYARAADGSAVGRYSAVHFDSALSSEIVRNAWFMFGATAYADGDVGIFINGKRSNGTFRLSPTTKKDNWVATSYLQIGNGASGPIGGSPIALDVRMVAKWAVAISTEQHNMMYQSWINSGALK